MEKNILDDISSFLENWNKEKKNYEQMWKWTFQIR